MDGRPVRRARPEDVLLSALQLIEYRDAGATSEGTVVEIAALLALAGINPIEYLRNPDELLELVLLKVARRTLELREIDQHNLAVEIANKVGEMLGG